MTNNLPNKAKETLNYTVYNSTPKAFFNCLVKVIKVHKKNPNKKSCE